MPRKVSHDELEAQKRIDALDHLCPSDQLLVITDLQATASFQYAYSCSQVLRIISLWRKIQAGKAPATFAYPAGANELARVILANDKHGIGSTCYLDDTNEWIVPERAIITIDEIMIPEKVDKSLALSVEEREEFNMLKEAYLKLSMSMTLGHAKATVRNKAGKALRDRAATKLFDLIDEEDQAPKKRVKRSHMDMLNAINGTNSMDITGEGSGLNPDATPFVPSASE